MDVRSKLWAQLKKFNASLRLQRDPNDNWTDNSDILSEVERDLATEYGIEGLAVSGQASQQSPWEGLRQLVLGGPDKQLLDVVEMAFPWMDNDQKSEFRTKVNEIFEMHGCPWRFADGQFFKLDADFVGAQLTSSAFETLSSGRFEGAANEYARARQDIASGDSKDAILYSTKSFESVLKVITALDHVNADRLLKELANQGYFDDLPENVRSSFVEQVMKTLPSLRNKLASHGQGAEVINIPAVYGELAVQLAAAFHNFLISKYISRNPPKADPPATKNLGDFDDDIPF
jgi:hypothetical protein